MLTPRQPTIRVKTGELDVILSGTAIIFASTPYHFYINDSEGTLDVAADERFPGVGYHLLVCFNTHRLGLLIIDLANRHYLTSRMLLVS